MCVCRESGGSYQLVRVEVVAQGAALLVVLSAARGEPPPLRIDNFSPVAIMFHQVMDTPRMPKYCRFISTN